MGTINCHSQFAGIRRIGALKCISIQFTLLSSNRSNSVLHNTYLSVRRPRWNGNFASTTSLHAVSVCIFCQLYRHGAVIGACYESLSAWKCDLSYLWRPSCVKLQLSKWNFIFCYYNWCLDVDVRLRSQKQDCRVSKFFPIIQTQMIYFIKS